MKLLGQKCIFPSMFILTDHWKCCKKFFFFLKYQHKWNAWLLVFWGFFFFSISVLFVYALLILIWHMKPAGFWKLADSDWVCLMGVKAQIKKAECVFTEMKCEIRRLQSIHTVSLWFTHALYTVRLSKISLCTQNRSLAWKRKSQEHISCFRWPLQCTVLLICLFRG